MTNDDNVYFSTINGFDRTKIRSSQHVDANENVTGC